MDFYAILDHVIDLLRQRQRVTYRALKVHFQLDDETLETLKDELIEAQQLARDENGRILVWAGDAGIAPRPASIPGVIPAREPLVYTPPIWRRRSSPPAVPSKASASTSPCCLLT
jgi:hypothetical protein